MPRLFCAFPPAAALFAVAALAAVSGCTEATAPTAPAAEAPAAQAAPEPEPEPEIVTAPPRLSLAGEWRKTAPGPEEKGCFAEQNRPAVVETVTEHVQITPERRDAATGTVKSPASYRTTSQARIVAAGGKMWFARVCPAEMTRARIVTLQRALAARGLYAGAAHGRLDPATQAAIRAYQAPRGLISSTLSLRAAREMGIVFWPVPNRPTAAKPQD